MFNIDHFRIPNLPVNPPYDHDEVNHRLHFVNANGATTNHAEVRELIIQKGHFEEHETCQCPIFPHCSVPFSTSSVSHFPMSPMSHFPYGQCPILPHLHPISYQCPIFPHFKCPIFPHFQYLIFPHSHYLLYVYWIRWQPKIPIPIGRDTGGKWSKGLNRWMVSLGLHFAVISRNLNTGSATKITCSSASFNTFQTGSQLTKCPMKMSN